MHNFYIWFSTGISHILNWGAYDHALFLLALCCVYTYQQWKEMLLVITAFTLGHSVALVFSAFNIFMLNSNLVEFLIALTIVFTCGYNIIAKNKTVVYKKRNDFILAAGFGIIHGMGFAGMLKEMMLSNSAVLLPLFSFNIGIEIGQILIVLLLFVLMQFFKFSLRLQQQQVSFFISIAVGSTGVMIAISRLSELIR